MRKPSWASVVWQLCVGLWGIGYAEQICVDVGAEQRCLSNVRQVTDCGMGFEKAGEAYFSPQGDGIAFQAVPTGQQSYQIYKLNLLSGECKRISTGLGACTCAYFHPDGNKMIFASSHEYTSQSAAAAQVTSKNGRYTWDLTRGMNIYESCSDGTQLRALTHNEFYQAECAYSPDGGSIVFASNRDGSMNLYVMDADGRNPRQLTHTSGCYNGGPFFSPNGKRIIFRADREHAHHLQLFVIDADGSHERPLTSADNVAWAPFWHPSGPVVAYTKSMPTPGHYQIYLLNVDTGREIRLTHSSCFEGLPSFNRAGNQMLWTSKRGGGQCQIFIADFQLPIELIP